MRFSLRSFAIFLTILAVEVVIALFVSDRFVRPFFGDVLAVAVVFYFWKAFLDWPNKVLAVGVLAFSWMIEVAQYFDLASRLGWGHVRVVRIVLGSTFDWLDLAAYTVGTVAVYLIESGRDGKTASRLVITAE